ncbi:MAG: MarR family transcriptional regulator [Proteobacteria bacterium]|nr:MarR family transcriptional regulator [Pseudomonadota bacterium]
MERVGLFWESYGGNRMAGRVLGWLLVCETPTQSITAIAEGVLASKASISTATRYLEMVGLIERVAVRGERAAYYRMIEGGWSRMFEAKQVALRLFRELAEEGLAVLDGEPAGRRERLQELHDLYECLEAEMPKIIANWRASRGESS